MSAVIGLTRLINRIQFTAPEARLQWLTRYDPVDFLGYPFSLCSQQGRDLMGSSVLSLSRYQPPSRWASKKHIGYRYLPVSIFSNPDTCSHVFTCKRTS